MSQVIPRARARVVFLALAPQQLTQLTSFLSESPANPSQPQQTKTKIMHIYKGSGRGGLPSPASSA